MSFFNVDYNSIIECIFTQTYKVKDTTSMFYMLCDLFHYENHRFQFANPLHQNSYDDPLHFSVRVSMSKDLYYTLHINGFFKGKFIVNNVSIKMMRPDGSHNIETIVKFNNY